MKKYFLLTALVSFVFLGLGNYSMGQYADCNNGSVTCLDNEECKFIPAEGFGTVDRYECVVKTQSTTTTTTNSLNCSGSNLTDEQQWNCRCFNDANSTKITSTNKSYVNQVEGLEGGACCVESGYTIAGLSVCSTEQVTACNNPKGGKWNGFACVCPTGTKNVDGVCTSCKAKGVCCGVELNTSIPFIGKCIESESTYQSPDEKSVTGETAFPVLMSSLAKILVTVILIVSFVLIILGGIMIATGNPSGGKKMIIKVVVGIALLGASGVILRLINPNFFG